MTFNKPDNTPIRAASGTPNSLQAIPLIRPTMHISMSTPPKYLPTCLPVASTMLLKLGRSLLGMNLRMVLRKIPSSFKEKKVRNSMAKTATNTLAMMPTRLPRIFPKSSLLTSPWSCRTSPSEISVAVTSMPWLEAIFSNLERKRL